MNTPVLQALVLADHIYQDKLTNKMIIAGTFTGMLKFGKENTDPGEAEQPASEVGEAGAEPITKGLHAGLPTYGRVGSPYLYICLTEVLGECELELRFVYLPEYKVLLSGKISVRCDDPLRSVEMAVPLPELPVAWVGEYAVELLHSNELLGSWRVSARRRNTEGET